MSDEEAKLLLVLRVQLFGAMQLLQGDALAAFWQLLDDVHQCRDIMRSQEGQR